MASNVIQDDLQVNGTVTASRVVGPGPKTNVEADLLSTYIIPVREWRVWDAQATNLPVAGAADDIGLTTGTFATAFPYLTSIQLNASGAVTAYARTQFPLPVECIAGRDMQLQIEAKMLTSVASVSATLDAQIYVYSGDTLVNAIGGDRVTTGAQSINTTTTAIYTFAINGATSPLLEPGDFLDIRLTLATNSATASSHFAIIEWVALAFDTRC